MILLISLIHGNNPTNGLDQHTLFLILESLNKLDPVYLDNFVFEYFIYGGNSRNWNPFQYWGNQSYHKVFE